MSKEEREKWIEQLQQKLDGYSEDVPHSVWDSIEKEVAEKSIPLWRRWYSIAAIIVSIVVSSVMVTLWDNSSEYMRIEHEKYITDSENPIIVVKESDIIDNNISKSSVVVSNNSKKRTIRLNKSTITLNDLEGLFIETTDSLINNDILSEEETQYTISDASDTPISNNQSIRERERYDVNKYQLSASNRNRGKEWSLAINSSGLGMNASSSNIGGVMMRLGSSNKGVKEAEVMNSPNLYGENYPDERFFSSVSYASDVETKKRHYQPVTLGLSVDFDIDREWSLETGLTYTSLLSKLESQSGSSNLRQEQNLKYIGIPLKLNRSIIKNNKLELYGGVGGEVEKCISGKLSTYNVVNGEEILDYKEDIDISNLQFSLNASLGVEYKLAKRVGIYAEPRLVYYFDDKSGVETIRNEHPFNFNIKLGLRFSFLK